ncbi:MAG: NYN domain-containing protein [Cellvibrionales bacterium]|nr:NYN domain-containing protein [Cellvibrionales bacterium]
MPQDNPKLAVLIDADNTRPEVVESLFEEIASLGEASVRRIYGDWSSDNMQSWRKKLAAHALIPAQQFAYVKGKNASDILMVIDAMDLLHKGSLDGFCLVSSDSDFTRIAQRIREEGRAVYGFGERKTPESFRAACTRFFYNDNLLQNDPDTPESEESVNAPAAKPPNDPNANKTPLTKPPPSPQPKKPATPTPEPKPTPTASPLARHQPSVATPMLRKAMAKLEGDDEWVALGLLGGQLHSTHSDFDSRTYSCANLSTLVRATGAFEIRKDPGKGFVVRRKK